MAKVTSQYQASEIKVLEGLEPVRKRPGMYIGSTDSKGLHHLAKEILDNAVDEAIAGHGKIIQLYRTPVSDVERQLADDKILTEEMITVVDNGRGIPVDMHQTGVSALQVVMTKLHAGGKFEETAYQASGGLHGVGAAAVNALSALAQVVVKREGKYYYQAYNMGTPQEKVKTISEAELKKIFPTQVEQFVTYDAGSVVAFVPDKSIFTAHHSSFSHKTLTDIIKDRAYLMAGLYFQFFDVVKNSTKHFYFEGGIKSLVSHINMHKKPLHKSFFAQGQWTDEETNKNIGVEIALQYNDAYNERLESYVNVIHTPDGGTHVNGFRTALGKVLRDYANKNNLLKEKESFTADDLREGLTAVVFVKMPANDLQFESQTKAKLNNSEAQSAVYQIFKDTFETFLEEQPKVGRTIIDKVMLAARARMAARAAKDAVIRKGALEGSSLPGKLADCQSRDATQSELFIVEGDSAGGCFSGDTQVALLDGRNISFRQLVAEHKQGKKHYCYTVKADGSIGVEKIIHPRITKKNATVIRVTLDNGHDITCTPDHKFMLKDGSYKKAENLTSDDSLMPLYRKLSDVQDKNITIDGYEMVWSPNSNKWIFTHLLADQYNQLNGEYIKADGDHCHHSDFNKLNNNPNNLKRLNKEEHLELHRRQAAKTLHQPEVIEKCRQLRKTSAYREKMSKAMKKPRTRDLLSKQAKLQWANPDYKDYMMKKWQHFYQTNPDYRRENNNRLNKSQKKYWNKKENRVLQSQRVAKFFEENPDRKKELSKLAKKQWQDPFLISWRQNKTRQQWTNSFRVNRLKALHKTYYSKTILQLKNIYQEFGTLNIQAYRQRRIEAKDKSLLRFDTFLNRYFGNDISLLYQALDYYNHRVVKVTKLRKTIDVYDLEVPGTHNFALASGVFVHNSAKNGRDRRYQAILPMFGKILNTERARLDRIVNEFRLKDLIIALGTGIGDTFDIEKLRYHRIILMADADIDGEHIVTLNLTFFYRHLPQVIEHGYLYIAQPPLYRIQFKKQTEYVYSDAELAQKIEDIKKEDSRTKISVQRFKGLGEMNAEQLWETTMNPESRILKKVTIADATRADRVFSTLMGDEVLPRKKFIQSHAKLAELDV